MKKIFLSLFIIGISLCLTSFQIIAETPDYARYVNPFIGNADNGHTFPGACAPFGMMQASPESGNGSWRYCSGFNYEDEKILGFAHNHMNGGGVPDLGDILLLPFSGDMKNGKYTARIDKSKQKATPGYYAVNLPDFAVDAEITTTERTALHKYTYNGVGKAKLLVDLQSGLVTSPEALRTRVLYADMQMPDNKTITGHNEVQAWVRRHFFYIIKFDKPYKVKEMLKAEEGAKAERMVLEFDLKKDETLQVKVAISAVSVDGASASLKTENQGWDFNKVKTETYTKWNMLFNRVHIKGTDEQKTNFYTSFYHLCLQPHNIADTDGKYRGADDNVHASPSGEYYSTLSLWDTYRAANPLYTLLTPEKVDGMVNWRFRSN